MKKSLVVGLDAACWEYVNPLLERGKLPVLQNLIEEGVSGNMLSTMPAHTPTAWASIVTGKNPGKHGVFDLIQRHESGYEFGPTTASDRHGNPFWHSLGERGARVGLVNVPFTHPPETIDGFAICGFGTPRTARPLTYPTDLLARIESKYGEFSPVVDPATLRAGNSDEIFAAERAHQSQLVRIAADMAREYQVDILVINLMLIDHANHKMPTMELVDRAIVESDADLGYLLSSYEPDDVMLFSDHGSRRTEGVFHLHSWLRDQGYVVQAPRSTSERISAANWVLSQWADSKLGWSPGQSRYLRQIGKHLLTSMPHFITGPLWKSIEHEIPLAREHTYLSEQLDHRRSRVYFGTTFSGLLYLNIIGREPDGSLTQHEGRIVAEELREALLELRDPNQDQPLFEDVHLSDSLYTGERAAFAPDLILDTYRASCNIATSFQRGAASVRRHGKYYLEDPAEHGHHTKQGLFVYVGSEFKPNFAGSEHSVLDLAPLLLYLYGVPTPADYDGRVPGDVLNDGFLIGNPIRHGSAADEAPASKKDGYSQEEALDVLDHLRALGYLD